LFVALAASLLLPYQLILVDEDALELPRDFLKAGTFGCGEHQLRCMLPGHPRRPELIEIENVAPAVR
jgi:hypothetical protein